jgi:hypothetical protein
VTASPRRSWPSTFTPRRRGFAEVVAAKPAIEPELIPDYIDNAAVEGPPAELAKKVHDPDMLAFLTALKGWEPRSHHAEQSYGNSLRTFVARAGRGADLVRWPADIKLTLQGDEHRVLPDFLFRRLLVEIKGDIRTAAEADRALGQVARYALAWKTRGPTLLIICGDCEPAYLALIKTYVTIWRRSLRIPISPYFIRSQRPEEVPTSEHPEWKKRALP